MIQIDKEKNMRRKEEVSVNKKLNLKEIKKN